MNPSHGAAALISGLLTGLLLLSAACVDAPRNNEVIGAKTSPVRIHGNVGGAGLSLYGYFWNRTTRAWDRVGSPMVSSSTPYVDAIGTSWYQFENPGFSLPQGADYWGPAASGRKVEIKLQVRTNSGYTLTSFDAGAPTNTCISDNESGGGSGIIDNCASDESPTIRLLVSCGASSQTCCLSGGACDAGLTCRSGTCLVAPKKGGY